MDNMEKEIEELQKYASLEGSELGEAFSDLIDIHNYRSYLSDDFIESVEKEIKYQLKYLKESTRIVEREEQETYKYKSLEWKDIDY